MSIWLCLYMSWWLISCKALTIFIFCNLIMAFHKRGSLLSSGANSGQRRRNSIQIRDLLLHTRTRESSTRVQGEATEASEQKDCYWDTTCQEILQSWRVSPAVPRKGRSVWFQTIIRERLQRSNPVLWMSVLVMMPYISCMLLYILVVNSSSLY